MKLNFNDIRKRIEVEKENCLGSWANFVGVPSNIVSNIHGKMQQNPSLSYIAHVSNATGKSVDYYLWGEDKSVSKMTFDPSSFLDQPRADKIIQKLSSLERTDPSKYNKVEGYIDAQMDRPPQKNPDAKDVIRNTGT